LSSALAAIRSATISWCLFRTARWSALRCCLSHTLRRALLAIKISHALVRPFQPAQCRSVASEQWPLHLRSDIEREREREIVLARLSGVSFCESVAFTSAPNSMSNCRSESVGQCRTATMRRSMSATHLNCVGRVLQRCHVQASALALLDLSQNQRASRSGARWAAEDRGGESLVHR